MSAEATNPGAPIRRRGRPRIDIRRLGRVALLGPEPRDRLPAAIGHVAEAHRAHHPDADLTILHKAYVLAESSHRGQMRKSGEPYITHPLAVTLILAELGAETTTLTASLLHDTVEDTEVTLDQVGEEFGEEVRYLVDGVTKLEKVDYGAAAEPETFRKMLVATGDDVRVMSIKLADRLHNMRTLGVMRPEKQVRIAKVTRDVLIPLAERLGVQALKTELEDLVFAILHPEEYAHTRTLIAASDRSGRTGGRAAPGTAAASGAGSASGSSRASGASGADDPLGTIAENVGAVLREAGISAEVLIRPRHFVSLHRVRIKRGELRGTDFGRLLVLVGEDADCYAVLGELHTCFTPVISEFKDFIAAPKYNLYQSLHTALAGRDGAVVEVLIRTHRMHKVAEAGVVALGNPYTPDGSAAQQAAEPSDGERADPTRPGWLSRLLDWQRSVTDPETFWTTLRADLAQDREITVLHPDGGVLGLPAGASCVDAAYARYGEGAHRCIGARVNGRLARLSTVLSDGDTVQLLLTKDPASGPSRDWLDHTRTAAARIAINTWLDAHPEDAQGGHGTVAGPVPAPARLLAAGSGPQQRAAEPGPAPAAGHRAAGAVVDRPDAAVRLAGCCTPVPPDAVTGFTVRGGAVTVHREECSAVARMRAVGRVPVGVRWGDEPGCRVTLVAESFGRPRLLADLTEAIATADAAIVSATVEPPSEQRVRHTYTLRLPDAAGLPALMRAMRDVPGVYDVSRAQHPAGTR
ncbi:RelA/SpoT family protein [Streptomyces sp. DT24]|uniref:RelA/SpoT family protein n=1 Tax=Streptomyces sp. DT24 TaxID=3416520 RepID=UPI003CF3F563